MQQLLRSLNDDLLSNTTRASNDSRVKFYEQICAAWEVPAWPISVSSVQAFGASLKAGAYKSSSVYYSALATHQVRVLGKPVEDVVRQCMKDTRRSISRGAGTSKLKASFMVSALERVIGLHLSDPFCITIPGCAVDMLLIMTWFMLRELEAAALRLTSLAVNEDRLEATLVIAVSKTDTRGESTARTLSCACSIMVQRLCPFHACVRHRRRLLLLVGESPPQDCPLFPADEDLAVASKAQMVGAMRGVLAACGIDLFQTLEDGRQLHKYGGHCARVSGAQWLHTMGLPLHMIQALGRWSSQAVLRYIQDAPLQVLPRVAATALLQGAQSWADSSSGCRPAVVADDEAADAEHEQPRKRGRKPHRAPAGETQASAVTSKGLDFVVVQPGGAELQPLGVEQQVESLRSSVDALKVAVGHLQDAETFIVQGRSRKYHKPAVNERANAPATWRSVCGWQYGLSRFHRTFGLADGANLCKRCFADSSVIASSSSDTSGDSGSSSSSSDS